MFFMEDKAKAELKTILNALKEKITQSRSQIKNSSETGIDSYIIFLSFCDGKSRATVCKGLGKTLETGWKNATDIMKSKIKGSSQNPLWIKADLVCEINEYSYEDFNQLIAKTKFFRYGIAFDKFFNIAFMEQEVKGNSLLSKRKESNTNQIDWKRINTYLAKNYGDKHKVDESAAKTIYTFRTIGFFYDGIECFELEQAYEKTSQRITDLDNRDDILTIIEKNSLYLSRQVLPTGQFRYGYFPCFHKELESYNILRHAGTVYSMIEAYEVTRSEVLLQSIELALDFLLKKGIVYLSDEEGKKRAFVLEEKNNELKLGANSASILALAKYTTVLNDNKYVSLMQDLAEGIEFFQNKEDHSFVHVLNYPNLSLKDKYRIVYYDGEATFALMRLYAIDHNKRWLEIAESAFDYFIAKEYWKYHDHWLSYASLEINRHKMINKIVDFNFKNCSEILDLCFTRERSQPVLLELLTASYQLVEKLEKENLMQHILFPIDQDKLNNAIKQRLSVQINSYFFPEVAMYFAAPETIMDSFYTWESSFRTRIDDSQHNLSGIINYYNNFL